MNIRIDARACVEPLECRLCLERCPEKVFGTYPKRRRKPGAGAGEWTVIVVFASECTGCMECVEFCPEGAIRVG